MILKLLVVFGEAELHAEGCAMHLRDPALQIATCAARDNRDAASLPPTGLPPITSRAH